MLLNKKMREIYISRIAYTYPAFIGLILGIHEDFERKRNAEITFLGACVNPYFLPGL